MERIVLKEFDIEAGHVVVHKLFGKDAREMMRSINSGADSSEVSELLVMRSVTLNGAPITFEILENVSFGDYCALVQGVAENFTVTALKGS